MNNLRISTGSMSYQSLNAILDQQINVGNTSNQLSTGKRVNTASDDPVASAQAISIQQLNNSLAQYNLNSTSADSKLQIEEGELRSIQNAVQSIRSLALSVNRPGTAFDQQAVVLELQQLLDSMVQYANADLGDGYLFGGSQSVLPPVLVMADGSYQYQGDESLRLAQIGGNTWVQTNDTGKNAFFGISSTAITLTNYSGETSVTSAAGTLVTAGSLSSLTANQLLINTVAIPAATADTVSTSDASASAIATAHSINSLTATHGVIAFANPNVVDLTTPTYGSLAANNLVINHVPITGTIVTQADLLNAINAETATTGVVASNDAGSVRLTASDGRNIELYTDGGAASATFGNLITTGNAILDKVERSTVTLNSIKSINIEGALPSSVGLTAGTYSVTANSGTGSVTTPLFLGSPPSNQDTYMIEFNATNPLPNYTIYAVSNPGVPLVDVNGVTLSGITYIAGQTVTVNNLQFQINGAPNPGDSFAIQLAPTGTKDMFSVAQNLISSIQTVGGNSPALGYQIGVSIADIDNIIDNLSSIISQIGTRRNLVQSQIDNNSQFIIFFSEQLSSLIDLDMAAAVTALNQQTVALDAAQKSYLKITGLTLFNYL